MFVGVVVSELLDPPEVCFGGTFSESFELDKAGKLLIPLLGSDAVILIVFFS